MPKYLVVAYKDALFDHHNDYRGSHDSSHSVEPELTEEDAIKSVAGYLTKNAVNNHDTTDSGRGGRSREYPYTGSDWEIHVFEHNPGRDEYEEPQIEDLTRTEIEARIADIMAKAKALSEIETKKIIDKRLAALSRKATSVAKEKELEELKQLAALKVKYEQRD